jgi:hypothetical protein
LEVANLFSELAHVLLRGRGAVVVGLVGQEDERYCRTDRGEQSEEERGVRPTPGPLSFLTGEERLFFER